jgi:hypothetical protein
MPGTGKTDLLAVLIKILAVDFRLKVLVSSFTHTALDNIIERLEKKFGNIIENHIVRFGNPENKSIRKGIIFYLKKINF